MRREANLLLHKAVDSLVLAIEIYNRPYERGRISATLIQLDHAFEMLLKASILHRGGRIREKGAKETIGFDACVRRALSDGRIKFIKTEQALVLQTINGLRDAAQHHLLDISEGQLYVHAQSGLTLFGDLVRSVFSEDLKNYMPGRVLPVSTSPPTELAILFNNEVMEIRKLLRPGRRRRVEADARLRPLAILDNAIKGEKGQPSVADLRDIGQQLTQGKGWREIFVGAASVAIASDGTGTRLSLRLTKKEGIPIQLVPEGTPGASVIAVRRINEQGYYNLSARQLADKLKITISKAIAIVDYLSLRKDGDCYKEFIFGKAIHKRYSNKAIERIEETLKHTSADEIWVSRRMAKRGL